MSTFHPLNQRTARIVSQLGERLTTVQMPPQGASGAPRRGCMRNPKRHERDPTQHEKNPNLQVKP